MATGLLALIVAAVFSGAAIYVYAVEHVARATLDDRAALAEWKPAYKRGAAMQASLALVGVALGAIAWWQTESTAFLAGAVLMLAPWPWTLLVIKPTNDRLLAMTLEEAGDESRALLHNWGQLHLVRMALGIVATLAFFLGELPFVPV